MKTLNQVKSSEPQKLTKNICYGKSGIMKCRVVGSLLFNTEFLKKFGKNFNTVEITGFGKFRVKRTEVNDNLISHHLVEIYSGIPYVIKEVDDNKLSVKEIKGMVYDNYRCFVGYELK